MRKSRWRLVITPVRPVSTPSGRLFNFTSCRRGGKKEERVPAAAGGMKRVRPPDETPHLLQGRSEGEMEKSRIFAQLHNALHILFTKFALSFQG